MWIRLTLAITALTIAIAAFGAPAASALGPCPTSQEYPWQGASVDQSVAIPSLTHPAGITSFDGLILRPADLSIFPGLRPVVLLQHGRGGTGCGLWWLAKDLAGHGYISVVWTSPSSSNDAQVFANAVDAMRSAIVFVRSAQNPYLSVTDGQRIALGGHSLGSIVTSYVQGDPDPGVKAAVALDNLRHWLAGDPGAAESQCVGSPTTEVSPRVPAIGFAMDLPCSGNPSFAPPDLKEAGFLHWRAHGVPSMVLDMAGFDHGDFAGGGTEQQHLDLAWFIRAWLARYLEGDTSVDKTLLSTTVNGRPTTDVLSTNFLSGAFLPGEIDTTDYRGYLLEDHTAPDTRRLAGPSGQVRRSTILRHGLRVRFASTEQHTKFRCRLDKGKWHSCKSPLKLRNAKPGRHTFRVQATDVAGNVEVKPAKWTYRVVP